MKQNIAWRKKLATFYSEFVACKMPEEHRFKGNFEKKRKILRKKGKFWEKKENFKKKKENFGKKRKILRKKKENFGKKILRFHWIYKFERNTQRAPENVRVIRLHVEFKFCLSSPHQNYPDALERRKSIADKHNMTLKTLL